MNQMSFFDKVYHVVKQIPYGRVSTYGLIAKSIGAERSARMVGYALNSSHGDISIPAHRVVNRKGLLTGKIHFDGINLMEQLLLSEGVEIKNNQVVNFKEVLWCPSPDLILKED